MVTLNARYRTLFYGLKLNHAHMATVTHPLFYLVRRIIFSALLIYGLQRPFLTINMLALVSILSAAFVITEAPWESPLITKQHLLNEATLYLTILTLFICANFQLAPLTTSAGMVIGTGWVLILINLAIHLLNFGVIAFTSVRYLIQVVRHHSSHNSTQRLLDRVRGKKDWVLNRNKKRRAVTVMKDAST